MLNKYCNLACYNRIEELSSNYPLCIHHGNGMDSPLLLTKFNLPPTSEKFVVRFRLMRLLDESIREDVLITLVCGPAGYGKTTVVSEWLQDSKKTHSNRFAWLTLDHSDDDLTRFLTYFISALNHISPGVGERVLRMLETHKLSPIPVLATLLINEISEISERFFLILDDYHLITAESIQSFIGFLVEHQPQQLCLVLITRADPPLPLTRLRARGHLVELRQADLSFTFEEAVEFINQTMNLALAPEQVAALELQTEGWIAGLQLAALSLRAEKDHSAFFQSFSGEHEFIADYLTDEVLANLAEPLRTFLLQTSILNQLSASLCEAVTQQPGAQAILEQLVDTNLFIIPMDNQQRWYRYHALFADLLRKRLYSTQVDILDELHRRASCWYEKNDQIDLAIEHAIAAHDNGQAARLIEQIAENLIKRGKARIVLRWLEAIPEADIIMHPFLVSVYGFALILCGRSTQVAASLLEKMKDASNQSEFEGELSMLQAFLTIMQGDAGRTIQFSEQALQQLGDRRPFFRSLAADTLGMGYTLAGDIPSATRAFEQVVEISRQSDNTMMTIMALTNLAGLQYFHGKFRIAKATCQQVLSLAEQQFGPGSPMIGKTLLNLAEIFREQGDLETANQYFLDAARLMENFVEIGLPIAYISLARLRMDQKDWSSAQKYIDQARGLAQDTQSTKMDDQLVELAQARLWIWQGELVQAAEWANQRGLLNRSPDELLSAAGRNMALNEMFEVEILILIRLQMAMEQPAKALELIDELIQTNEQQGYKRRQVELFVLKALTLFQMDRIDQALDVLEQSLLLGELEGYQMTFIEHGEPMAQLLYRAVERNIYPVYASRLLKAITEELPKPSLKDESGFDLVEPLSDRELEVLCLIAEGLTNREIAKRLYISLSTVKGHTTNIFGKLNVRNRTKAVARGRNLGLLPPE